MRQFADKSRAMLGWMGLFASSILLLSTARAETLVYLTQWGTGGTGDGQFDAPYGVAVDASGNVYVTDTGNSRVQKFTGAGEYLTQWGSFGTGNGQFEFPRGVAVDGSGNIYVADTDNHRIQKFDSSGAYLAQWGSQGNGSGEFVYPSGVAVNDSGDIYVTDSWNDRVQKFDSSGGYLTQWGSEGSGNGEFHNPEGLALDAASNVYVADYNDRIQKFDSSGRYLTQWGSFGSGNGEFNLPAGVATGAAGDVYVADSYNYRIQKFDTNGAYLTQWGSSGNGNGEFALAQGLALDASSNVYVVDSYNHRIQKFTPGWAIVVITGPNGSISPGGTVGVPNGGSQTFAITPDAGYYTVDILIDNVSVPRWPYYAFTKVTSDHTITASFAVETNAVGEIPPAELAVSSANPVAGSIMLVRVELPNAAPAILELIDVAGRCVATREVGLRGAGRYAVNLSEGNRPSPGLYFMRLTQGTKTRTARVVVIQ